MMPAAKDPLDITLREIADAIAYVGDDADPRHALRLERVDGEWSISFLGLHSGPTFGSVEDALRFVGGVAAAYAGRR